MIVGVAQMSKRKFFVFNVIGAVLWGGGVTLLGYVLGDKVPWVRTTSTSSSSSSCWCP